ncbi:MAG: sigma-70 family RNA polymerase sigma factor [bacterium]|nr:sigma-70 family RNA polymerase sigma factor [bacterium]
MTDDERTIIRNCLAGHAEPFETLVTRYESHVKALAWNISGNPEDAMEISQDTFLQAFQNLHRFDPEKNFKNWLLGITVKRSIDKLRKRKTFLNFFARYAQETPLSKQEIRPIEESHIFHPLLNRLNHRERIALSLQMNENYSAGEIGEILNCSDNSVRVILFKAKRKLKRELTIPRAIPGNPDEVIP